MCFESIKRNMLCGVISNFGCEEWGEDINRASTMSDKWGNEAVNGNLLEKIDGTICEHDNDLKQHSRCCFAEVQKACMAFMHDFCPRHHSFMIYGKMLSAYISWHTKPPTRFKSRAVEKASAIIAMCTALRFMQTLYTRDYRRKYIMQKA